MKLNAYAFLLVLFTAVASGCSITGPKGNGSKSNLNYSLIAENLVDVLASLESNNRINTTFQMVSPSTPIGKAVYKAVEDEGYGIQIVSGDIGDNFLRYKAEISQTESGLLEVYSLSVANTEIQRQYGIIDGKTSPTSPVTIRTDSAINGQLDDSLFGVLLERSISSVIEVNTAVPQVVVFNERKNNPFDTATPLKNVRDIEESNYQNTFEQYQDVVRLNLRFKNDSLVLGSSNKDRLNQLVNEINPGTDIVSVIGCSHGQTAFNNGNQLLAEGRAQRVTESLMFAGLDPNLIFDEACWDSEYFDEQAPRRGVMVTHKRLKSAG